MPEKGPVLIVGLGNRSITADSLGPYVLEKVIVTRHLLATMPDAFSGFRDVSAVATGVLGVTGIETQEIVKGLCQHIKPACIIAIDALASRSLDRLGRTFQLSDSGIIPGEGAQNRRFSIDKETTGVPVIAIGVPTVVEALTLALDLMGDAFHEQVLPAGGDFLVTPSGIDALISKSAKAIGYGINLALHGDMSLSDMEQFLF